MNNCKIAVLPLKKIITMSTVPQVGFEIFNSLFEPQFTNPVGEVVASTGYIRRVLRVILEPNYWDLISLGFAHIDCVTDFQAIIYISPITDIVR